MSSPTAIAAAETGLQEAAVVSGTGSPAGVVLAKLPSWGASGWQALFKQPSAGAANLTDMLTEPGGEGNSTQLGGEAGASPLFKWTSDGSMMEELMKAYKDSSPGTPTFGGGAQGNTIFRDGSLMRDGSLYKDGSITSCLQAAFQAQMEEEEQQGLQEGGQVGASATPQQAAPPPQAAVEQTPANPPPFTFTAVGTHISDSPQLHVPELQLGPQLGQDFRQSAGSQLQVGSRMMPTQTANDAQRQDTAQTQQRHQQQQPQQQPPLLQQLAAFHGYSVAHSQPGPSATAQAQLQMPAWTHQPLQYQYTSQAVPQPHQQAYTVPQQQQQPQPQLQGTVQTVQVASSSSSNAGSPAEQPTAVASNSYASPPTQYAYPQLPGPTELGIPLGNQTESYGAVSRTVITSGAMGGDVWSRPNSRPVSPGNQRQAAHFDAAAQVVNPDGSMQSVPRIVIRISAPMAQPEQPKQGSPPRPSQQPVVLNSRVVQESGTAAPESAPVGGYAHAYALYHVPQQHQARQVPQQHQQEQPHAQGPYGMHQYQQAAQHHQQHSAPYQVRRNAISAQQQSVPHYQTQQLPQQSQQQLPQQQQQKLPQQVQQEQQRIPRPGSFQELLSAPVLPERYNSAPLSQDPPGPAPSLAPVQQQQQQQMTQGPAVQSSSVHSGQVLRGPFATSQGIGPEQLQYSYAPTHVPRAQQMTPAQTDTGQPQSIHAYRRQQQQQQMAAPQHVAMGALPSSSSQYLPSQTSSSMYPPMQFPAQHAAGGSQPMQMLYGHPYHGQSSQGMGQQRFPLQQQQQLPQQLPPEQQQAHPQAQQPRQQGQHPYAHESVMNASPQMRAPDSAAQAAFQSPSGFQIPPPVGQLGQSADGPYSNTLQSLEQRSPSVSSQSDSYQSGHTLHESAAANAAQSQHQAVPSVGTHQRQQQPKQQQNVAAQSQHSYQAVYQQQQPQQQHQLPASTQAGGVLSQTAGGLVWRGIPGPACAPGAPVAAGSGPMMSAGFSGMQQQPAQQMPGWAAGTAEPQSSISHGTVLLTSKPVTSPEATITGKVVSFAPEPAQEQQQNAMPSIPGVTDSAGSAKEIIQDQASQQAPPPQPGRKFKRDRSSRKNSFSLPPVPPKKQASAAAEFSPATSLEFVLHGAASAPLTSEAQGFPAELAAANMRHSASAQDMVTDTSSGDLPAAAAASEALCGDKSSRSSSADVIFCADGIDFNSRAWKMMSRKEKNRASAAASRARREAYTESLEHKVRKLQAERDWLQEQIEPGSVERPIVIEEPMLLPARPPVRHLSL
ncbi:TPA: hypothetical protein ACH3X1_004353 [Trebouxia sp. C0004]